MGKKILCVSILFSSVLLVCTIAVLSGVRGGTIMAELLNTYEFEADGDIHSIKINSRSDKVYLYASDTEQIVIKEYSSETNPKYMAKTRLENGTLYIEEGKTPIRLINFYSRYIEVYIPQGYNEKVVLNTRSGRAVIDLDEQYISDLTVSSDSGRIELEDVQCDNLLVKTGSGRIEQSDCNVSYCEVSSTSGRIEIKNIQCDNLLVGARSGRISQSKCNVSNCEATSTSGRIDFKDVQCDTLVVETTSGRISQYDCFASLYEVTSRSGRIEMSIDSSKSFTISATNNSGSIRSYLSGDITVGNHKLTGTVGGESDNRIVIKNTSGAIEINGI